MPAFCRIAEFIFRVFLGILFVSEAVALLSQSEKIRDITCLNKFLSTTDVNRMTHDLSVNLIYRGRLQFCNLPLLIPIDEESCR